MPNSSSVLHGHLLRDPHLSVDSVPLLPICCSLFTTHPNVWLFGSEIGHLASVDPKGP